MSDDNRPSDNTKADSPFVIMALALLIFLQTFSAWTSAAFFDKQATLTRQAWEMIAKQQDEINKLKDARNE